MPFKSKAQRRWMYATHPAMANRWEEHTSDKNLPEKVSSAYYSAFLDELEKLSSPPTEEMESLLRAADAVREKMMPAVLNEQKKWKDLGFETHPLNSVMAGINLPTEGGSDIDLNLGSHEPHITSKKIEELGVPLREKRYDGYIHAYTSPEGYDVELKVRPKHEVDYQLKGWKNITSLPREARMRIIHEKHRLKSSGDEKGYKDYKSKIYEEHGMVPPGGDWSSIAPKDKVSALLEKIAAGPNIGYEDAPPGGHGSGFFMSHDSFKRLADNPNIPPPVQEHIRNLTKKTNKSGYVGLPSDLSIKSSPAYHKLMSSVPFWERDHLTNRLKQGIRGHEMTHWMRDKQGKMPLDSEGKVPRGIKGAYDITREEIAANLSALKRIRGRMAPLAKIISGASIPENVYGSVKYHYPEGILRGTIGHSINQAAKRLFNR